MSSHTVDYFAVLGRGSNALMCEDAGCKSWDDAITDIQIFESVAHCIDDRWEVFTTSLEGNDLRGPFIAVQRRSQSKRLDHITELCLIADGEPVPLNFEKIHLCSGLKKPAILTDLGYLAFRRAGASQESIVHGQPMIDDIAIVLTQEGEEIPPEYTTIPSRVRRGPKGVSLEETMMLVCKKVAAMGLCDLRFSSTVTDRYPNEDRKGRELPVKELPLFVFPVGMRLKYSRRKRFPLPTFFTFVFTDAMGSHLYAACLRFYELVPHEQAVAILMAIYGTDMAIEIPENVGVYCPKVICVISSHPFYQAMRLYLSQLYSMSLSSLPCPLEFFIAALVAQVPLPIQGGRVFHFIQDISLISGTSKAMPPIVFDLPAPQFFPHMDLDFSAPLRCLSVEHVLVVLDLMLKESKIVFLCTSNNLLTAAMESFRSLIFPLKWSSTFISRLPDALTTLFQAPGGFMIGLNEVESPDGDNDNDSDTAPRVAPAFFSKNDKPWLSSLVAPSYVVDLTSNGVYKYDGSRCLLLNSTDKHAITSNLPAAPTKRLVHHLFKLCRDYAIGPQRSGLRNFDSAFDFQKFNPDEDGGHSEGHIKAWETFPTLELRDHFMVFMVDVLGEYEKFIIPPSDTTSTDTYRTFSEEFAVDAYVESHDPSQRQLIHDLMETQMFGYMIQRRTEATDFSLVFFEQTAALLRQLGLCGSAATAQLPRAGNGFIEAPAPAYKLLLAARRLKLERSKLMPYKHFQSGGQRRGSGVSGGGAIRRKSNSVTLALSTGTPEQQYLAEVMAISRVIDLEEAQRKAKADEVKENPSLDCRMELDQVGEEIQALGDVKMGPLIIPGPQPVSLNEETLCKISSSGFGSGAGGGACGGENGRGKAILSVGGIHIVSGRFTCSTGWPDLSDVLFDVAQRALHPRVRYINQLRAFAIEQVSGGVLTLVRPPQERASFVPRHVFSGHAMVTQTNHAEGAAIKTDEEKVLIGAVLDIAATCSVLLGVRVVHQCKPTSDLLQILGILSQLDERDLLPYVDTSVWRSVLLSCGESGGFVMRKISRIIYETMAAYRIPRDSITFGLFSKAMAASKVSTKAGAVGAHIDQHSYLNEIGLTWFFQRSALLVNSLDTPPASPLSSFSPSLQGGGLLSSSLSMSPTRGTMDTASSAAGSKRRTLAAAVDPSSWFRGTASTTAQSKSTQAQKAALAQQVATAATAAELMTKPTDAAKIVAEKLQLQSTPGAASFLHPVNEISLIQCQKVTAFRDAENAKILHAAVDNRLKDVVDVVFKIDGIKASGAGVPVYPAKGMSRASDSTMSTVSSSSTDSTGTTGRGFKSPPPKSLQTSQSWTSRVGAAFASSPASTSEKSSSPTPFHRPQSALGINFSFGSSLMKSSKHVSAATAGVSNSVREHASTGSWIAGGGDKDSDDSEDSEDGRRVKSGDDGDDVEESSDSGSESATDDTGSSSDVDDSSSSASASTSASSQDLHARSLETLDVASQNLLDSAASERDSGLAQSPTPTRIGDNTDPAAGSAGAGAEAVIVTGAEVDATTAGASVERTSSDLATVPIAGKEAPAYSRPAPSTNPSTSASTPSTRPFAPQANSENKERKLAELQQDLENAFAEEFHCRGHAIGIYSMRPCACGMVLLDDEILSRILLTGLYGPDDKGTDGQATSSPPSSPTKAPKAAPTAADHVAPGISCPACNQVFTPHLHVRCFKNASVSASASNTSSSNSSSSSSSNRSSESESRGTDTEMQLVWSLDVPYLSPARMRVEVEEALEVLGQRTVCSQWLHTFRPSAYWNVVWYAARMGLPTGFVADKTVGFRSKSAESGEETSTLVSAGAIAVASGSDGGGGGGSEETVPLKGKALKEFKIQESCRAFLSTLQRNQSHMQSAVGGSSAGSGDSKEATQPVLPATTGPGLWPLCDDRVFNCPVFIGWRTTSVEAQIRSFFHSEAPHTRVALTAAELLPGCTTEEIESLVERATELDSALSGMRQAMLDIHSRGHVMDLLCGLLDCPPITSTPTPTPTDTDRAGADLHISEGNSVPQLSCRVPLYGPRKVYTALLVLSHLVRNKLAARSSKTVYQVIVEGDSFSKCFQDSIRCTMSPKDFQALQTTEADLLGVISNRWEQVVRGEFGFLL